MIISKFQDLTGMRFGRLFVLSRAENSNCGRVRWRCRCDCGEITTVAACHLVSGHTQSCGCLHEEAIAESLDKYQKGRRNYNQSKTRLYKIYYGIRARTGNPTVISYSDYGGRGITMCNEWKSDFSVFKKWALSNGYNDELSIDRIDANGNYEPSNCRWADATEQANNKRTSRKITFCGKALTVARWAEETGLSKDTIKKRLDAGMSPKVALTKPLYARACKGGD